jgi:hypothetical protein
MNRSTRSCAHTIAVRRPIGNTSVMGSACIPPRNSKPPTRPATTIVTSCPNVPGQRSATAVAAIAIAA